MERIEKIALLGLGTEHLARLCLTRHITQHELHERFGHCEALDHIGDGLRLGTVGAHEFEAGGRRVEQIAQAHRGAVIDGRRSGGRSNTAGHGDLHTIGAPRPAGDGHAPHGGQRRQSLATKPEGVDVQEVRSVDLGGRMARQGERQVFCRHPAAIVLHPNERLAAVGIVHRDAACACVERVLHEFLDCRRRPLHHLAGSNAVDSTFVQLTNDRAHFAYIGVETGHTARLSMVSRDSETAFLRVWRGVQRVAASYHATIRARSSGSM